MLQIKPVLCPCFATCYDISYLGYEPVGVIWVDEEGIILEKTRVSFNIEDLEQIIAFMKSLEKETGK